MTLALVLTSEQRADLATHNGLLYTDFQRIKGFSTVRINYLLLNKYAEKGTKAFI